MPELYPTFPVPQVHTEPGADAIKYGRSWEFDFGKGDFVLDGAGKTQQIDGYSAWVQWCKKTAMTERSAHIIYDGDYGVELDAARRQPTRAAVESDTERTITEALMVDPRTQAVRDFQFSWDNAALYVSFTVYPTIGDPTRIEVII